MKQTIIELENIIHIYTPMLYKISEPDLVFKPAPEKWSKKEIIGHLIDSVQNNIRRFVVAQYEEQPQIIYAQNYWVTAAAYQDYNTNDLIALWQLLNKHACIVLKNIPAGFETKECLVGTLHTIEWLAQDCNKHLLHHLHQVLYLEPVAYP